MAESRSKSMIYLVLVAIHVLGVILFVWQELPAFTHVVLYPGLQLSKRIRT
jgi:hypothetical protein